MRTCEGEAVFFPVGRVVDAVADDSVDEVLHESVARASGQRSTDLWILTVDGPCTGDCGIGHVVWACWIIRPWNIALSSSKCCSGDEMPSGFLMSMARLPCPRWLSLSAAVVLQVFPGIGLV